MRKSNLDIPTRLLCLMASIDEHKLENKTLNEEDWAKLTRACGKLIDQANNEDARKYWGDVYNNIFNFTYGARNAIN